MATICIGVVPWSIHFFFWVDRAIGTVETIYIVVVPWSIHLFFWVSVLIASYIFILHVGAILLISVYPWIIKKNYTIRWRRLLLYGGKSYRTILLLFAWVFQARPLDIVAFYAGVWAISKVALTSPMKRQVDPMEIWRDMREGGNTLNAPIPHLIFLCISNLCMGVSRWRMVLSGFTIIAWWFKYHFEENYCRAISPTLTMILAWECSWFDFVIMTYGEAMKPTFGKRASAGDIKMPTDGYCFYHCFTYAGSNGASPFTCHLFEASEVSGFPHA